MISPPKLLLLLLLFSTQETAEYNQIIKNLQKDVQEKVDQNEVLVERIKELCSQDSEEGSRVTELQFQVSPILKYLFIKVFRAVFKSFLLCIQVYLIQSNCFAN